MNKIAIFLSAALPFFGFEKLDPKYCVRYGNPNAPTQAVEYFSLSCPKCMDFFQKEFPSIQEGYIKPGTVSWTLHPDPADLLTLQAMICIGRLPPEQKTLFLEAVMSNLAKLKTNEYGCRLMKAAMEVFENPVPELDNLDFIKTTQAFEDAFAFVMQEDVVTEIPSLEIDGIFHKEYPSQALLEKHIANPKRSS